MSFKIVSDRIDELLQEKKGAIVCGASFGDEGKGKITDAIAHHPDIDVIARVNSGENAGHTVVQDGKKYVFHLAPSGLLTGKLNAIGPNCVMDPLSFMDKEMGQLVDVPHQLVVDNVHIVTPYHKLVDLLRNTNASTMKGMSAVHMSKVFKRGVRLDDILNGDTDKLAAIFREDMDVYEGLRSRAQLLEGELLDTCLKNNEKVPGRVPNYVLDFLGSGDKTEFLTDLYLTAVRENTAFPERGDVVSLLNSTIASGGKVLLEAPQSFYLSNDVSHDWRSSTSANCTAAGVLAASGINPQHPFSIVNVHKTPASSRVGLGQNPAGYVPQDAFSKRGIETLDDVEGACTDFDGIQSAYFAAIDEEGFFHDRQYDETWMLSEAMAIASSRVFGERGATTLKPRVTGFFDAVKHARAMVQQGPHTFISALDRGNQMDNVGLVVAYRYDGPRQESHGKVYERGTLIQPRDSYPDEAILAHCTSKIEVMQSWRNNPLTTKTTILPEETNHFLERIQSLTGAEIIGIGVGPDTKDVLYLR